MKKFFSIIAILSLIFACPVPAFAASYTSLSAGSWSNAGTWSPSGGPPTSSDTADVTGAGHYVVVSGLGNAASSSTVENGGAIIFQGTGILTSNITATNSPFISPIELEGAGYAATINGNIDISAGAPGHYIQLDGTSGSPTTLILGSGYILKSDVFCLHAGGGGLQFQGSETVTGTLGTNHALNEMDVGTSGIGTVTVNGAVNATTLKFSTDSTLTMTGAGTFGSVSTAGGNNTGTLSLGAASSTTGDIGASGANLKEIDINNAGTNNFGGSVYAKILSFVQAGTVTIAGNSTVAELSGAGTLKSGSSSSDITLTVGDSTSTAFSGTLADSASKKLLLTKQGSGTLTLSGTNTYSGATTITGGTLNANSSAALGDHSVTNTLIFNGGTLQAGGTITSEVTRAVTLISTGLIDTNGNSVSIAGTMSGAGGVTKSGAGTLTLSGANTYTGATTVNAGTLLAGADTVGATGAFGNGSAVTVASGATLDLGNHDESLGSLAGVAGSIVTNTNDGSGGFGKTLTVGTDNTSTTFAGVINNTGLNMSLTKVGKGTLVLSGANTYTGPTTVNNGELDLNSAGTAVAGNLTVSGGTAKLLAANQIAAGSSLAVSSGTFNIQTFNQTLAGVQMTGGTLSGTTGILTNNTTTYDMQAGTVSAILAGTAALNKTTGGTVTLSGANTYTGGTTLGPGTMIIGNNTAFGTAALTINTSTIDTNGADITLTNNNLQNWNGDFTFTGTNNLDLGTGAVTLNATHTVTTNAETLTVGGIIGGAGFGLIKAGNGTLTLNGANTYSGDTTITAGTVQVGNASALGNGGNVFNNGATLNVGSIALNVGGTYFQNAASTLVTAINGTSNGKIIATGTATALTGYGLTLNVSNYVPNNTTYTIIQGAAGGAIAAPAITVTGNNRTTFTATTLGNNLVLTATRTNSYNTVSTDANTNAVGKALEGAGMSGASGGMMTVLNILDGMSGQQVANSIQTMHPDVSSGMAEGSRALSGQSLSLISDRLGSVRSGIATGSVMEGAGFWVQALGSNLKQGERQGIEGYQANTFGTTVGVDKLIEDHFRVGLAAGFGYADVNCKTPGSPSADIESWQGTLYGSYDSLNLGKAANKNQTGSQGGIRNPGEDSWYVDGMFSFTQNNYDSSRNISLGNSTMTATADNYAQQYSTKAETGYTFVFQKTKALEVTPFASLGYNYLDMNAYKESGAGALDLSVQGQGYNQLEQALGTKFAYPVICKKLGTFIPSTKAAWLYDYFRERYQTTASFAGGGPSFVTTGARPAQSGFLLGGELAFLNKGNMTVTGNWDMVLKEQYHSNTYYGSVRYDF